MKMSSGKGSRSRSAAVNTATTPGAASGIGGVDADDPGVGHGRPDVGDERCALEDEIVDVGAPTRQQLRILDPHDSVAQDAHAPRLRAGPIEGRGTVLAYSCPMTMTEAAPAKAPRWTDQWKELYDEVITTGPVHRAAPAA